MISVVILTKNEESALPDCLKSVQWSDDVVVFDSFSTDQTVEIARLNNARVCQRKFDNYALQRTAALQLQYKNQWVLMLDADERVSDELKTEMIEAIQKNSESITLYCMRRKDFFFGKWLKHSSGYPTWFGRLMRMGFVWIEREINEEYHTKGEQGYLSSHIHHYPFTKGVEYWIERHNKYSTMEAVLLCKNINISAPLKDIVSANPVVRRKALKQISYRLPLRPILVFFYLLVVRRGLFDGRAGIYFVILRSMYEYMIYIKAMELRHVRCRKQIN